MNLCWCHNFHIIQTRHQQCILAPAPNMQYTFSVDVGAGSAESDITFWLRIYRGPPRGTCTCSSVWYLMFKLLNARSNRYMNKAFKILQWKAIKETVHTFKLNTAIGLALAAKYFQFSLAKAAWKVWQNALIIYMYIVDTCTCTYM